MNLNYTEVDSLVEGYQINLFLGSFISNRDDVALVVNEFKRRVIDQILNRIRLIDPRNFLIKHFQKQNSAIYRRIWLSIDDEKFEEFLEKFGLVSQDDDLIFKLVKEVYDLPPASFNFNHLAAAEMLASGRCRSIYTTNFDLGLENACARIGFNPEIVLPDRLHLDVPEGCIVKMHGCARYGQIVADSTSLNQLAMRRAFKKALRQALTLPTITMGYSGLGDVDIAFELKNLDAKNLIYGHYKRLNHNPLGSGPTLISDLMSAEIDQNILLHWCPWTASHKGASHVPPTLSSFSGYSSDVLEDMLVEVSNKRGVDLHIERMLLMHRGLKTRISAFPVDPDFLRIPAYRIGLEMMMSAKKNGVGSSPITDMWMGFTHWRLRQNRLSQEALQRAFDGFVSMNDRRGQVRVCEMIFGLAAQDFWESNGASVDQKLLARAEVLTEQLIQSNSLQKHANATIYVKTMKRLTEVKYLQGQLSGAGALSALGELHQLANGLKLGSNALEITYTSSKIARWSGLKSTISEQALRADLLGRIIHNKKRFAYWLGPSWFERWLFSLLEIRATDWFDWLIWLRLR